jgi:hypothetical protein
LYLLNFSLTFALYLRFTQNANTKRLIHVRNKKNLEKD